ncbi:GNAT family N-acetyltransferase [Ferruginibacter sp. SUN002]|uniref:GNAT family N-acetyltransferase n=1 Tax=Ferruginibacter sp. SUN002 TaxID=2937789 RepID=UPI003D36F718
MQIKWVYKTFNELESAELYAVMQLRNEVFVVEQNCVYQDADGKDSHSWHLMGWVENDLAAYCRILPPGLAFSEASIGRVVSSPRYRKEGYGREMMKLAIEKTITQFNCKKIMIGAQLYLKNFYASLGFVQTSEIYLEDNIEHIEMELSR